MNTQQRTDTARALTPAAVQGLQRRVKAFAATGATSHAPTTYRR